VIRDYEGLGIGVEHLGKRRLPTSELSPLRRIFLRFIFLRSFQNARTTQRMDGSVSATMNMHNTKSEPTSRGLLVHFSAQRKRFLLVMGCILGLFRGFLGVLGGL